MDLIHEGSLGLRCALDRLEPAHDLRLSTYAIWWVRPGIAGAVANQGRTIRLPAYLQDRLHLIRDANSIRIFGSGEAKGELDKQPKQTRFKGQIAAKVRVHSLAYRS